MAYVADVAMYLINRSIAKAEEQGDERYYMNSFKMKELLFIAACKYEQNFDRPLFHEPIVEGNSKFHIIEGTYFVPKSRGFGLIKKKFDKCEYVIPSVGRCDILDAVLDEYGIYDEVELVNMAKKLEKPPN